MVFLRNLSSSRAVFVPLRPVSPTLSRACTRRLQLRFCAHRLGVLHAMKFGKHATVEYRCLAGPTRACPASLTCYKVLKQRGSTRGRGRRLARRAGRLRGLAHQGAEAPRRLEYLGAQTLPWYIRMISVKIGKFRKRSRLQRLASEPGIETFERRTSRWTR